MEMVKRKMTMQVEKLRPAQFQECYKQRKMRILSILHQMRVIFNGKQLVHNKFCKIMLF